MQGKMIFREMSHVCSFEGANLYSSLAQSVEHAAVNRSVVGSSPTGGVEAQWLSWLERRPVTAEVESSSLFWVVNIL